MDEGGEIAARLGEQLAVHRQRHSAVDDDAACQHCQERKQAGDYHNCYRTEQCEVAQLNDPSSR